MSGPSQLVLKPGITATIMTKNSLRTLPSCLDSLAFCDAIVVVDDYSTDGTHAYLQTRAASDPRLQVYQQTLTTFSAQRRFLHEHVCTEWMLILDADEEALPGLEQEVTAIAAKPPRVFAYRMPMQNLLPAHWPSRTHYWNTQKRFLFTSAMSWPETQLVHAPAVHAGGTGELRSGLLHHSFDSVRHLLRKQLSYGLSGGLAVGKQGKRVGTGTLFFRTVAAFLKSYFIKGLWRFGPDGLVTAGALAFHVFAKYSAAWEAVAGSGSIVERDAVPAELRSGPVAG